MSRQGRLAVVTAGALTAIAAPAARAESAREDPAAGPRLHLAAIVGFAPGEVVPLGMLAGSYRFRWLSAEAGLTSFIVRTDAAVGLRGVLLAAGPHSLTIGGRVGVMIHSLVEVSDDPILIVTAGYERWSASGWGFTAELGSLWILEKVEPDQALAVVIGLGRKL